jgi:hypothetical protein
VAPLGEAKGGPLLNPTVKATARVERHLEAIPTQTKSMFSMFPENGRVLQI